MSNPRYGWWGYVKDIIRRYPELKMEYDALHAQSVTARCSGMPGGSGAGRAVEEVAIRELPTTKQREYEAVRRAIQITEHMKTGRDRLMIIDLVFWKQTRNLEGAALLIGYSYDTAQKWHSQFIHEVAEAYGLKDV